MMKKENTSVLCADKRKEYEKCRLELIFFDGEDVLTTSGDDLGGFHDDWFETHTIK